ncbi:30S ribosomal protein S16 [uncultured Treponema sp.]|uniref:30S ribosomal protein S16 n=1 Tax=uncultured Treponema sp. TaxID=162155 RepID=UPI0025FFD40C|nr:30S ribosomal protein S16 [uncultured Treponema sp.]
MVKIRLKRLGAKKRPCYRIVVQDSRVPRDGVTIEEIGTYQPVTQTEGNQVTVDMERAKYWIGVGAQPTETVKRILSKNGLNK